MSFSLNSENIGEVSEDERNRNPRNKADSLNQLIPQAIKCGMNCRCSRQSNYGLRSYLRTSMKRRLSVTHLHSENNLPMF